jgi:competence protein ComEC
MSDPLFLRGFLRAFNPRLFSLATFLAGAFLAVGTQARAEQVRPSERVETGVIVRAAPSTAAERVASLLPAEAFELIGQVPGWYRVRLPDGRTGYVSKSWTVVVATTEGQLFRIHGIDVGTGLAIFVEGPDFTLLYDAGSNDDTARGAGNRVLAYLRRARPDLTSIDHVVLSHPHKDHVELLADVLGSYSVRNVWDSGRLHPICGYRRLVEAVTLETGVAYHDALSGGDTRSVSFKAANCYGRSLPAATLLIQRADRISSNPVRLGQNAHMTFLHADGTHHPSPNENSLVMRLDIGSRRILFMGDAEAGGRRSPSDPPKADSIEGKLLSCCAAAVRSDVLIAGHHGSMTSSRSRFLDAVGAEHFVISAGPTRYGSVTLPDAVVVQEMQRRGSVWRTDTSDSRCGAEPAKIGADRDGNPGGCDNIRIDIGPAGSITASYDRSSD